MGFETTIAALALATFLAGSAPYLLIRKAGSFGDKILPGALFFSAGLLMGAALFHLLPESFEAIGEKTGFAIMLGFVIFYAPQKYIITQPCEIEEEHRARLGLVAFAGIAIHSIIDGVGVGAAEFVERALPVTFAVIGHKLPAAFALAVFLLSVKMARPKALLLLGLFSLATPLGALATNSALAGWGGDALGYALGFSAGNLMAIASGDLMRRSYFEQKEKRAVRLFCFVIGLSIFAFSGH